MFLTDRTQLDNQLTSTFTNTQGETVYRANSVKHLKELIDLRRQGYRAAVIFVSQRSDARSIISNDEIDPLFGKSLRKAHLASVELYAYNCNVTKNTVSIKDQIPVNI